jgi:hypothetical protein
MSAETSPSGIDRRVAPRFQPAFGTVCRFDRDHPRVGLVWNLSRTGVSMLLADPPEAGTKVVGELTAEGSAIGLPVTLHVVHVRPVDTGDYLLGARFVDPLDPEQMRPFLASTQPPADQRNPLA